MKFYRVSEDWVTHLTAGFRVESCEALRALSLARIQKYPPPKLDGLPFGNEGRVFLRYVRGESSLLDASALSSIYRFSASAREKLLYRAFRQNDSLPLSDWVELIGERQVESWARNKLLRAIPGGTLRCRFAVIAMDGLLFIVDPLNDHGGEYESVELPRDVVPSEADTGVQPFYRTYIGQDSLRMIEFARRLNLPRGGRYLDCGTGAGAILLSLSRRFDEAVGIEINPRAVNVAQFNAELNTLTNCSIYLDDALALGNRHGRFSLVTWNLPFMFFPETFRDFSIDGYGGDMGIEVCLRFIAQMPELLSERGECYLEAMSPILISGENLLEKRLAGMSGELKLDVDVHVAQSYWASTADLWEFHRSRSIRKFESVFLHIRRGSGKVRRIEAPASRRALDRVRERLYQKRRSTR
jgi:methylase of polypeptide subunit release factors